MCISYINRLKSAPKAPKILGDFGLLIRKPPLVLAAFGTRGGFLIIITTDLQFNRPANTQCSLSEAKLDAWF